jgi:hypothetical protein
MHIISSLRIGVLESRLRKFGGISISRATILKDFREWSI